MSILEDIAAAAAEWIKPECGQCEEKYTDEEVVKETIGFVYCAHCPNCGNELWVESLPEAKEWRHGDSIFE